MPEATSVKQLVFSDLYLGHSTLQDRFCDVPGAEANPLPASAALRADLDRLIAVCNGTLACAGAPGRCKVRYDGVTYHMTTLMTAGGRVYVLRRIADVIHTLAELGIPGAYVRHLVGSELSGLFIVAGPARSGKTNTACALVKERLAAHGGVAVTGEDLIELPLEGSYGDGVCYQTTAGRGAGGFREVLAAGAQIVLVDEIRDQDTASAVLRASRDGCLIVSTMVADSVSQAMGKLENLAAERMGAASAKALIAAGMAGVLHQQLNRGQRQTLETELLFLHDAPLTRKLLRNGEYDLLGSDIKQQMASMIAAHAAVPVACR
jgi:twitching motility protein PilT